MSDPEGGGEVRSVSSTGGEKGTKLARFDLIPAGPLTKIAEHFGIGASKYADRNWEKGYEWSKSYAALQRHLVAWWGGEDNDPELGSSHLQAAGFHVLALLEYLETHPEFDDRPTTQTRRAAAGLSDTEEDFYSSIDDDECVAGSECEECLQYEAGLTQADVGAAVPTLEKFDYSNTTVKLEGLQDPGGWLIWGSPSGEPVAEGHIITLAVESIGDNGQMVGTYFPKVKQTPDGKGGYTVKVLQADEVPLDLGTTVYYIDPQGFVREAVIDGFDQVERTSDEEPAAYRYLVIYDVGDLGAGIWKTRDELYVRA